MTEARYWEAQYVVARACERLDELLADILRALESDHLDARTRRDLCRRLRWQMGMAQKVRRAK